MKKKLIFLFILMSLGISIIVWINKLAPVRLSLTSNKSGVQGAVLGTTDNGGAVVNVRDFGAVGDGKTDDTSAFQNALNSSGGRSVFVPKGKYVITSTLTFATNTNSYTDGLTMIGEGKYNTIFDNRISNGALLNLNAAKNSFQTGGRLEGFGITTSTNFVNSSGIALRGIFQYQINNIRIEGLSGDGIKISSSDLDADGSGWIQISNTLIIKNGGYGIISDFPSGQNTVGNLSVTNSYITTNGAGGIKHNGVISYFADNSVAQNRGTGGIYVPYNGIHAQNMTIERNEFDSNVPNQVNVEAIVNLEINMNTVSVNPLSLYGGIIPQLPIEGFRFGHDEGGSVINVHAFLNRFRIDVSANPFTAFVIGKNASRVRILDTSWQLFGASGQTRFNDNGHDTTIEDETLNKGFSILGDINRDGRVDIFDYNTLVQNFGKTH